MAALSGVASERRLGAVPSAPVLSRQLRSLMLTGTISLFAIMLVTVYLMPLGYSAALSVRGASVEAGQPLWPSDPAQFTYAGEQYDLYNVPIDGTTRQLALPGSTPARSAGSTPARRSDDLPTPDGPTIPTNVPEASRATSSDSRRSRPQK